MVEKKYTEDSPWVSDEVKGNKVSCFEKGALAECRWKNLNREGGWDDVFILRSLKVPKGFKESIEFTEVGMNLIEGTDLENKLKPGSNVLELN